MRLSDVTDFSWSDAHFFVPYACSSDMRDVLGFEWTPLPPLWQSEEGVDCPLNSEEEYLLVFVDPDSASVVGWTYTYAAGRDLLFPSWRWPSISATRAGACLRVVAIEDLPDAYHYASVRPVECHNGLVTR